jgi:transcriptional regulator with XRE-family HTH domain
MAKKFSKLRAKMPASARKAADREFERLNEEYMSLKKLRSAREKTQTQLAKTLHVTQSEVSKIEGRTDLYISTLAAYIKGLGGELEIAARFRDGKKIRINQFEDFKIGA